MYQDSNTLKIEYNTIFLPAIRKNYIRNMQIRHYLIDTDLNNKDVAIPAHTRPHMRIQKLLENFIMQLKEYKRQKTCVMLFLPNLSASGPVNVPNVKLDPKPVKNNIAI